MGYTELTEQFERREKMRGTALTILGGVFWGLAGVFGKYSFEHRGMTPQWLVNVRLIIAGLILLSTVVAKQKKDTFRIWKNPRHVIRMMLYGMIGIAACQMTYYMAVDDSNAGIATVLQYVAPVIIMLQGEICRHIKHGGMFITSGIINTKEQDVKDAMNANTELEIVETTYQGDWVSITARRK